MRSRLYFFNLLYAFNCLQPMKKFAFSVASRATCRLQIKPRDSGDENAVFPSKDNRTVKLTRQDFLPDRTADRDLLFIFSSNILDFRRSLSSYIKIWLAVRRLIATLLLSGPPRIGGQLFQVQ